MSRPTVRGVFLFGLGQEGIRTPPVGRHLFIFIFFGSSWAPPFWYPDENVRRRVSSGEPPGAFVRGRVAFVCSEQHLRTRLGGGGGGDKNITTDTIGFCARRTRRVSYTNEAEIVNDERFAVVNHRRRIGRDSAGNGFEPRREHSADKRARGRYNFFGSPRPTKTFGQSFSDA